MDSSMREPAVESMLGHGVHERTAQPPISSSENRLKEGMHQRQTCSAGL